MTSKNLNIYAASKAANSKYLELKNEIMNQKKNQKIATIQSLRKENLHFGRFEFLLTAEGSVDPAPPELDVGLEFMGKKGSNVKYSQKKMAEISIKSKKITERMELRGLG